MYLCTEGKILAHADVDMSLLLPGGEWQGRSTWEFGRAGLEGDFQLRLPGEPLSQPQQRGSAPVVTIGAELSRVDADLDPSNLISSAAAASALAGSSGGRGGGATASRPGEVAGAKKLSTWSYLAPARKRGIITAALQRLELKPMPSRGGSGGGSALSYRGRADGGVLVGITGVAAAAGGLEPGMTGAGAGGDSCFRVVGCGERGDVDTEDSELLETITWRWEGEFPDHRPAAGTDATGADGGEALGFEFGLGSAGGTEGKEKSGGAHGPLASIKVLAPSGGGRGDGDDGSDGGGDVEIATGLVPWPSSACSGRQYVNVTLLSPEGAQVGSCRVCLLLSFTAAAAAGGGNTPTAAATGTGAGVGGVEERHQDDDEEEDTSFEEESELQSEDPALEDDEAEEGGGGSGGRRGRGAGRVSFGDRVRTTGVQAEEPPLEGTLIAAGGGGERGTVPHGYRMSINLASVKDLENAAYVVRTYVDTSHHRDDVLVFWCLACGLLNTK